MNMEITETINLAISLFTLVGFIFAVYLYFRKPQIKSEQFDAVIKERFKNHEEMQTQQFRARDDKLIDLKVGLTLAIKNLKDNDLHEIKVWQNTATLQLSQNSKEISNLATVIDERIPKIK